MVPNWLPIRCDLHDDPAVIAIANATGTDEFCVVGRLVRLWSWANEQLPNGNAVGVTTSWIDRYLYCPGFAEAMVSTGWLLKIDNGVEFPKFEVWNSQGAKIRKVTAKRVERHRAKSNAPSVTPVTQAQLPTERVERESKESPTVSDADASPTVAPKKSQRKEPTGPHADARRAFCERWQAKYGAEYKFEFGKHGKMLTSMLAFLKDDAAKLATIFDRFFADSDQFYAVDSRHDFSRLSMHFNRWAVDAPPDTPKVANGFKTKAETPIERMKRLQAELDANKGAGHG